MFPWAVLQAEGASLSEKFITTYRSDFRPIKDRQPWPRTRPEVRPAPGSCQAKWETWPVFFQHLYKTTNNSYSSAVGSQHPSGSPFPTFLPSFGSSTPPFSEAARGVHSAPKEALVQEAGVAKETGLLFGAGNRVNMLEQQEPKDGVQYQEGVILLSQNADTLSCDDVLRVLGKEAGPQFLLGLPVVSGPFITPGQNKDGENWQNHLRGWNPVRTFSPCEWTPERPAGYFEAQHILPHSCRTSQPLVCGQQRHSWTRPGRKLPLTEYQDRFAAEWVQPQIQQTFFPPCNMNLYPSI